MHRFYEPQYPDVGDLVMVKVVDISDVRVQVQLLEYGNIEGMIMLSELSRRRMRSIRNYARVGQVEAVMVLRVDTERGYIDLSKKQVNFDDIAECKQRYGKSSVVHSILARVAETQNHPIEQLYQNLAWPLYEQYPHCLDAFKQSLIDPNVFADINLDPNIIDAVQQQIRTKYPQKYIKIRAYVELTCFNELGIEAIRTALLAGMAISEDLDIKLVAPPKYIISINAVDRDQGLELVNTSLETIQESIVAQGGTYKLETPAKAINDREETEHTAMLERLARENREIDGDEDM